MGGELIAALALGDEGTELDVLDRYLLGANVRREDGAQFGLRVIGLRKEATKLLLRQVLVHALDHAVVSDFGGIGDEGEDRVLEIPTDGTQDGRGELLAEGLALPVNISVTASGEVDALEATSLVLLRGNDLLGAHLGGAVHQERLTGKELGDLLCRDVHHRLDDGTLRGKDDDFVIDIIEGGTDAVRVPHGVALATARLATHDEAPIPERCRLTQDIRQVDALLDVVGDIHAFEPLRSALDEEALYFTVETMPELLQEDVHVGDVAWVLSDGRDRLEDVSHVRQVEVPTDR